MRIGERIVFAGALAWVLGFAGASAFNPDDGVILRNEVLWTVCGLGVYVGFRVTTLGSVALALAAVGRRRCPGRTQ